MLDNLTLILPLVFAIAAIIYLWLGIRTSHQAGPEEYNAIGPILFLIGVMIAGSALTFNTIDPAVYNVGRVLGFFSAGFLPVVLFTIYRQYVVGTPSKQVLAVLSIVPVLTLILAVSNPWHNMLWAIVDSGGEKRYTHASEHFWFSSVFAPYAYGLFAFSAAALASRLPTVAAAYKRKVTVLLICAVLPFAVSFANTQLGIGPPDFPFTSTTLVLLIPLYWWASISLRVHDFSPLAYQNMFDHVRDPIIVLDRSQRIVSANTQAQALLKSSEQELIGKYLWEDLPEAKPMLETAEVGDLKKTVRMNSDDYFEFSSTPLIGPAGQVQGTVVICRDITERKVALQALADSEQMIRSLVEHSSNGILRFAHDDEQGSFSCSYANSAAELFLRKDKGTLIGMPLLNIDALRPELLLETFGGEQEAEEGLNYEAAVEIDEVETWLRVVGEPVGRDFSITLIDVTERKRDEDRMLADALRDPLTGILNRRGFEREADKLVKRCDKAAVLYMDLNEFKSINDRFGHQAGDVLLKAFGHRLEFCLRTEDVVARMGGDEFVIVLPDAGVEDAKLVAERLVDAAAKSYVIDGQDVECAASIGIALMPDHGTELWHLIGVADQAMYKAKSLEQNEAANDRAAYVESAVAS